MSMADVSGKELSQLQQVTFLAGVKFRGFELVDARYSPSEICSLSDVKFEKMLASPGSEPLWTAHHRHHFSRVYPSGLQHMNSSNYDPSPFWSVGAQMIALNFQVRALCPFLRSLAAFSQCPPRCSVCGCVTALLTAGDPSRCGLP